MCTLIASLLSQQRRYVASGLCAGVSCMAGSYIGETLPHNGTARPTGTLPPLLPLSDVLCGAGLQV